MGSSRQVGDACDCGLALSFLRQTLGGRRRFPVGRVNRSFRAGLGKEDRWRTRRFWETRGGRVRDCRGEGN